MALNTEIAELMDKTGTMFEVAEKVEYKQSLTSEEKDIYEVANAWAKSIGEKGYDDNREIAAFVNKTVTEEIYNAPDELLDTMFDRGTIGEFDDVEYTKTPKNTLVAYEAAKGGNVNRSWIDMKFIKPQWKNRQIETDLSYIDMRRNGFKSISTLLTYATEALKNYLFLDVFSAVDNAITGGDQVVSVTGATPTIEAMDKLTLWLADQDPSNMTIVALSKYIQAIGRMPGFAQYMSEGMKDEFNRYGMLGTYGSAVLSAVPSAKKLGDGSLPIPDKRIFDIAGKIGELDMKGEVHTYQNMDNNSEVVHLLIKDFTYGYAITNIDNVAKITFSA